MANIVQKELHPSSLVARLNEMKQVLEQRDVTDMKSLTPVAMFELVKSEKSPLCEVVAMRTVEATDLESYYIGCTDGWLIIVHYNLMSGRVGAFGMLHGSVTSLQQLSHLSICFMSRGQAHAVAHAVEAFNEPLPPTVALL